MVKFTAANLRTIATYGEHACLDALHRNEVVGEGANTIGGGDTRKGDNLINAGRKLRHYTPPTRSRYTALCESGTLN